MLGVLSEEGLRAPQPAGRRRRDDRAVALDERVVSRPTRSACGRFRRTISSSSTRRDTTRVIGETDFNSALEILHPKAIYIVEGRLFQVEELDFEGRKAYVRDIECDYYTDAITYSRVTVLDTFASAGERPLALPAHGDVHVVSRVVGFKKIKFYTNENVGRANWTCPSGRCTRRRTG